jgi:biopolymer transport protein ExbD
MATKEPESLSAAQRSKIRKLSEPKELAPDEEGGELNIVPFLDIIMNVLMFVLATVSVTFTATIDTTPAKRGGSSARPPSTPTLGFSIFISADGFGLKASGGNVAPGCNGTGSGLAVPKANGDYDYQALKVCADKLKKASPDFAGETQVGITANPNIPYQIVISTMDAVRKADNGDDLFPDVNFGIPR